MEPNPYEAPKIDQPLAVSQVAVPARQGVAGAAKITPAMMSAGQIAIGFLAGIAIWAISAPDEAWDVNQLYSTFLLLAGLVTSFGRPRAFYWGIVGIYLGQVFAIHMLIPAAGVPIMPPFVGVLFFGTIPAAVGATLGAGIGLCVQLVMRHTHAAEIKS